MLLRSIHLTLLIMHSDAILKQIAATILRRSRISAKLKREALAASLNISKSAIDKMEQGVYHIKLTDIIRLAPILNMLAAEFVAQIEAELKKTPPPQHTETLSSNG